MIATEYIESLSHKVQYLNQRDESSTEDDEDDFAIKEELNEDDGDFFEQLKDIKAKEEIDDN